MDRRFDVVCVLNSACFCACVNACAMIQLRGCQISKDTKNLGGYLGTYPITRFFCLSVFFPAFVYLEMSLFSSIFLYHFCFLFEWRVHRRSFLPNCVFLPCDHGLDFLHQFM